MTDKKKERRGLGRGLSALMADVNPVDESTRSSDANTAAEQATAIEKILPNTDQPRRDFDQDALNELADSIREKGVIQPLILRNHPREVGKFEIVAGERRWRASQIANLHEVPAIVRDYSDTEMLEIAIIENIQRAELNSIEEAAGYRQLMDRFGHTQEKIAEALGKSRSHVANLLRLLNLPDDVQAFVREGKLSAGHARALVTATDPSLLAKEIIKKGLSVRDAESMAKKPAKGRTTLPKQTLSKDADTVALENDLSAAMGLNVKIDHSANGESGKISIVYRDLDDLDKICGLLSAAR